MVATARMALTTGDFTPVLKWVKAEYEPEIRSAFARTMKVRSQGAEARELADTYFFETLVRLHRAGEGAPYTGLKSDPPEPVVLAADKALETGSAEALMTLLTKQVTDGIQPRFERAVATRKRADLSVAEGREYVAAYVELTHYVEALHLSAAGAMSPEGHTD